MVGSVTGQSAKGVIVINDYSALRVPVHGYDVCGSAHDDGCCADVFECGCVCHGELHPEDGLTWVHELLEDTVPVRESDVPLVFLV